MKYLIYLKDYGIQSKTSFQNNAAYFVFHYYCIFCNRVIQIHGI